MSQYDSQFEEDLYQQRRETLQKIAALGQQAYPNSFAFDPPDIDIPKIRARFDAVSAEELEATNHSFAVAGRILAIRLQGKAGFATLQQGGQRLQIYVRKDDVGEPAFDLYKLLDLGDHIGVTGTLMRTRTGELTLKVATLTFLTKAMLPLPDKFSGLGDIELRYRRRYLDLFTDTGDMAEPTEPSPSGAEAPSVSADATYGLKPVPFKASFTEADTPALTRLPAREVFVKRAAILRSIRNFFDTRGYLEVETPMLHTIAGGAAARTFNTHHNAEDMQLILRIAPELHLKRLVVGGLDRVYEINRNFRNEGIDRTHNPEFTMLEFYQAYASYHDLMDITEELIKFVATEVNGTTITHFNGKEINLGKWTRLSMRAAIMRDCTRATEDIFTDTSAMLRFLEEEALSFEKKESDAVSRGISFQYRFDTFGADSSDPEPYNKQQLMWLIDSTINEGIRARRKATEIREVATGLNSAGAIGKAITAVFEMFSEPHLIQPTIIYDFPLAVSPLSKVKPDEPDWVERFEFYIGGFEVGNAFSELNDPDDQLRRFEAQVADKDPESMAAVDHDYVRALGYGLPPTAGEGIGIDRLTMVLTGSRTIRDVILFPLMRPVTPSEPTS
jgi:lysyl-tRNA synthetase class 2